MGLSQHCVVIEDDFLILRGVDRCWLVLKTGNLVHFVKVCRHGLELDRGDTALSTASPEKVGQFLLVFVGLEGSLSLFLFSPLLLAKFLGLS